MVADDLVTQQAKASPAMLLTWLSRNILVSAKEGFVYREKQIAF